MPDPGDEGTTRLIVGLADSILEGEPDEAAPTEEPPGESASVEEIRRWSSSLARWAMEVLGELGVLDFPGHVEDLQGAVISEAVRRPMSDNVAALSKLVPGLRRGGVRTIGEVAVMSIVVAYQSSRMEE